MRNLFGEDVPAPPNPEPAGRDVYARQPSLIDAAAERIALESGKPLSQCRTELTIGNPDPVRLTPTGPDITDGGIYRIV